MEKIPTAEEFLANLPICYEGDTGQSYEAYFAMHIPEKLKVFAKLHVKAALEAASQKATIQKESIDTKGNSMGIEISGFDEYHGYEGYNEDEIKVTIEKESILLAYPEENIK